MLVLLNLLVQQRVVLQLQLLLLCGRLLVLLFLNSFSFQFQLRLHLRPFLYCLVLEHLQLCFHLLLLELQLLDLFGQVHDRMGGGDLEDALHLLLEPHVLLGHLVELEELYLRLLDLIRQLQDRVLRLLLDLLQSLGLVDRRRV